ncbi:MAG: transposase [Deltaproteobacteria bacterium]|nr:transposase [Deltaproteobacteria bacterium]
MTTTGMPRHRLTDAQWELIGDLFPTNNFKTGRRPRDRRLMLDAIFWVLRTGAPWRDLPECFGPWSTAWDFFDKWTKDETFDRVLRRLRSIAVPHDADPPSCGASTGHRFKLRAAAAAGKRSDPQEPADHALGRSREAGARDPHPV